MKQIYIVILAIATLFVACSKDDSTNETESRPHFQKGQKVTITATVESDNIDTRVIGSHNPSDKKITFTWTEADKGKTAEVTVDGEKADFTVETISDDGTTATFTGKMPKEGSSYSIQYPKVAPTLTGTQNYTEGQLPADMMLFKAEGCTEGNKVKLNPQYSALNLNLYGSGITVGTIKVTIGGTEYKLSASKTLSDSSNPTPFFIVLPAISGVFTVDVLDNESKTLFTKTTSSSKTFTAGKYKIMPDIVLDCFYFEAVDAGATVNLSITSANLQYLYNSGWTDMPNGTTVTLTNTGDKVYIRATSAGNESMNGSKFFTSNKVNVGGNIMYLLNGTNPSSASLSGSCFKSIFENTSIVEACNLNLPALTMESNCYFGMFNGCSQLTKAPNLPATTLEESCYHGMFQGCKLLTDAPAELVATVMQPKCYMYMFSGCSSLVTPPTLPASQTLSTECYYGMFNNCSSLTSAPSLPATKLKNTCYREMFSGCSSLSTAPELGATTLTPFCYYGMFSGCSALTTAPSLKASTVDESSYQEMFKDCSKLSLVEMFATNVSATNALTNWLSGAGSGATSRDLHINNSIDSTNESTITSNTPTTGDYPWTITKTAP